jgi:hypothetical protein
MGRHPILTVCLALVLGLSCGGPGVGSAPHPGQRATEGQSCSQSGSGSASMGRINVCGQVQVGGAGSSSVLINSTSSGGAGRLAFTAANPWRLDASWSCGDPAGTFSVEVRRGDGSLMRRISEDGDRRLSVQFSEDGDRRLSVQFSETGEFRLDVRSSCPWHVTVVG